VAIAVRCCELHFDSFRDIRYERISLSSYNHNDVNCQNTYSELGWFAVPDLPEHRTARFLTAEEKEYAISRLGKVKRATWDQAVFQRVFLSWQFYLLPLVFMRKHP
jgi:hypothetical protein